MKYLNKIIATALFCLFIIGAQTLSAQHHRHHGHMPPPLTGEHLEELKAQLNLSDIQVRSLETIHENYKTKMDALKDQEDMDPADKREAMHDLMKAQRAEVEQIFTAEQKQQLTTLRKERRQEHREMMSKIDREGLRKEVKAYRTKNMLPVMIEQRKKLEPQIAAADKATLDELSAKFKERHAERKKEGVERQRRNRMKGMHEGEGRHGQHRARHGAPEDRATIKALVDKYDSQITALLEEIKPQAEQWEEDLKAIHEKYLRAAAIDPDEHKGSHKGYFKERRKEMHKGRFLLLNPEMLEEGEEKQPLPTLKIYPNPASNSTVINYEVPAEGSVTVEIRSDRGNLVKILEDQNVQQKGEYTLQIDLGDFQPGVYYISLKTKNGVQTQKLTVIR